MSTIKPFPELVAYAEAEARARVVRFAEMEGEPCAPDGDVAMVARIELSLLCDLTRPASYDAVVRLVAARMGYADYQVAAICLRGLAILPSEWPPSASRTVYDAKSREEALAAMVEYLWRTEG